MQHTYLKSSAFSLVEMVVGIGLMAFIVPVIFGAIITSREGRPQQEQRQSASRWMQETIDAVRNVREKGWSTFAVNGTFHPTQSGGVWSLASGSETLSGRTRSVVISDVYRNTSGTIVSSGGTLDPSTKKVVVTISWNSPISTSMTQTMYITRYNDNATFTHTTTADFSPGTSTGLGITSLYGDGDIILSSGGTGNWCAPQVSVNTVDLPKSGVANAISATQGHVFAGTGDNASGVSFAHVTINQASPPAGTTAGTFDGYKTNDIFGDSSYAYLATDNNSKEIVIISIAATPYTEVGTFNAQGSTSANSVYVSGNYGYMTQGTAFRIFDLSSKTGSRSQVGSLTLTGTGNKVVVNGNYAYVAINSTSTQLQIIDISNKASPTVVGTAALNAQGATAIYVNSSATRAYIATAASATQNEFFIVDISTKTGSHSAISSYDTNGMSPKGISVVPGSIGIVVGTGGEEYQVLNLYTETSITRCGGTDINTGVNGISSVLESDGDAFSYIITGDSSSELKIIAGGFGGQYTGTGTYLSSPFSLGYTVAFNRASWTYSQPSQTTFKLQFAVANMVNNSCTGVTYTYVGPGGDTNAYYTATNSASIPFGTYGSTYQNPGQCMRYKLLFTSTDPVFTPRFSDITVNYSP